jgi:hypothetical protein
MDTGICAVEPTFLIPITRLSPARGEGIGADTDIATARYTPVESPTALLKSAVTLKKSA